MIETVMRCDSCKSVVEANRGFQVEGNIMAAGGGGGFVGDNLVDKQVVQTQHFCGRCFTRIAYEACEAMRITPHLPHLPKTLTISG